MRATLIAFAVTALSTLPALAQLADNKWTMGEKIAAIAVFQTTNDDPDGVLAIGCRKGGGMILSTSTPKLEAGVLGQRKDGSDIMGLRYFIQFVSLNAENKVVPLPADDLKAMGLPTVGLAFPAPSGDLVFALKPEEMSLVSTLMGEYFALRFSFADAEEGAKKLSTYTYFLADAADVVTQMEAKCSD